MKVALPAQKTARRVKRELVVVISVVLDGWVAVATSDWKSMCVTKELGPQARVNYPYEFSFELSLSMLNQLAGVKKNRTLTFHHNGGAQASCFLIASRCDDH